MVDVRETQDSDIPKLLELGRAEEHSVFAPTHTIWKDGEIAGCMSIGGIAMVGAFLRKDLRIRDTIAVRDQSIGIAKEHGYAEAMVIMGKSSPVYPYFGRLGFTNIGECELFFIKL